MFLHIERGSQVPISRQIAEQIRSQCLSGGLQEGAKLPSVRETGDAACGQRQHGVSYLRTSRGGRSDRAAAWRRNLCLSPA